MIFGLHEHGLVFGSIGPPLQRINKSVFVWTHRFWHKMCLLTFQSVWRPRPQDRSAFLGRHGLPHGVVVFQLLVKINHNELPIEITHALAHLAGITLGTEFELGSWLSHRQGNDLVLFFFFKGKSPPFPFWLITLTLPARTPVSGRDPGEGLPGWLGRSHPWLFFLGGHVGWLSHGEWRCCQMPLSLLCHFLLPG